jgi:S1-C subfamily serine protease
MNKAALLAGLLAASAALGQAPPQRDAAPPAIQPAGPEDSRWTRTIERVASGIVTIQIDQVRAFDTEWNSSSQATGFVVDAARGLILTNHHVVTPGPVTAQAVFVEAALHQACGTAAASGRRAGGPRNPRGR